MIKTRNLPTLLLMSVTLWSFPSAPAQAATVYISDQLTVPLRSGPSGQHRILHNGLPSGTTLEIVSTDEAAGFTQIVTERGTQGWIRSQYLVNQPIAKVRLERTQSQLRNVEQQLADLKERNSSLDQTSKSQVNANEKQIEHISQLRDELTTIKKVSAAALDTEAQNQLLTETNTRLRDELDDLSEAYNRLESNAENEAILIGAGLILLGLLAGVLIKARPQRSA